MFIIKILDFILIPILDGEALPKKDTTAVIS
jgi:hypothetical protein